MKIGLYMATQLSEAKAEADESMKRFPTNTLGFSTRLYVACLDRDVVKVADLLEIGRRQRMPDLLLAGVHCAAREGRMADARELLRETVVMLGAPARERRGRMLVEMAFIELRVGNLARARELIQEVEATLPANAPVFRLGYLFAEMGDQARVQPLLTKSKADYPTSTARTLWTAMAEASLLLAQHKPEAALDRNGK